MTQRAPDQRSEEPLERPLPWLPGERLELAIDARKGVTTTLVGQAVDVCMLTNLRVVHLGTQPGKRVTSAVPMARVSAVEVVAVTRPVQRLSAAVLWLLAGALAAAGSWIVAGQPLISLLAGGVPVLVGVYILSGYLFPDANDALVIHASGFSMRLPLLTPAARRDAYLMVNRIGELLAAEAPQPATRPAAPAAVPSPAAPAASATPSPGAVPVAGPEAVRASDTGPSANGSEPTTPRAADPTASGGNQPTAGAP